MPPLGLTRARTMGPIAQAVTQAGGSLRRVFGRADLPLTLLDEPDRLILLRDQLTLVEAAIREIGDPALPARLSTRTGLTGLGPIGIQVRSAQTLGHALARVEAVTPLLLQTATWTGLAASCNGSAAPGTGPRRHAGEAFYGYMVAERIGRGRQSNEILALGYLLGTVRHFLGPNWRPQRALVTGAVLPARSEIEALYGCEIALGTRAGLLFPADRLATQNPLPCDPIREAGEAAPIEGTLAACVAHLIALHLDEGRPTIDAVARRLGLARRTLQRRLEEDGTSYAEIQRAVLSDRAKSWLAADMLPIGRIALDLGYADPAHFTRAFLEWTGTTPSRWRRAARGHLA